MLGAKYVLCLLNAWHNYNLRTEKVPFQTSEGCLNLIKWNTPRYSWSIAKVGVKHQLINQS